MDPYLRIIDRGVIIEAARHALSLHQWIAAPDFDQEGAVQQAERHLAGFAASAGTPLLATAHGLQAWLAGGGARGPIARIIRDCRLGIHDISRTDLNSRGLPRFNMALELGLFLGAKRFGTRPQTRKSCLVLDRDKYRYQEFISDIAGQDIVAHADDPTEAIMAVRDWLSVSKAGVRRPPGGAAIAARYGRFLGELPRICADAELQIGELTFVEFADMASTWLRRDLGSPS
jgi:hypothetical protein